MAGPLIKTMNSWSKCSHPTRRWRDSLPHTSLSGNSGDGIPLCHMHSSSPLSPIWMPLHLKRIPQPLLVTVSLLILSPQVLPTILPHTGPLQPRQAFHRYSHLQGISLHPGTLPCSVCSPQSLSLILEMRMWLKHLLGETKKEGMSTWHFFI